MTTPTNTIEKHLCMCLKSHLFAFWIRNDEREKNRAKRSKNCWCSQELLFPGLASISGIFLILRSLTFLSGLQV